MQGDRQPKPADLIALMEEFRARFADLGSALPDEEAIRADERRKVAEEIAAALLAVDDVEWALGGRYAGRDAAAIARKIGGDRG